MANQEKFHLGICMAGAVTAGSYTAGVIDYLLETLERWELQKEENRQAKTQNVNLPYPDLPMHDVVIDVITGASAGGMCAAITTAMLAKGIDLEEVANKKSLMYRAWIDLDDSNINEGTIKKMLDTSDIKEDKIFSLLNSSVISNVAKRTISKLDEVNFPPFVDEQLDVILTLSNIKGKKFSIEFNSYGEPKSHYMTIHRDFMHFKLKETFTPTSDFLEFDFEKEDHVKLLQESAVATGAFPIGLQARELSRSSKYYINKINSTIGIPIDIDSGLKVNTEYIDELYPSLNIDGGVFNNEPFGETEAVLNKKAKKSKNADIGSHETNIAILMIDPFPNNKEEKKENITLELKKIIPKIIGALRAESLFKTQDLLDSLSDNNYTKYMIIPKKSNMKDPLCCATLGAFGGFLFKAFREHDYNLGRRNAQNFLREYFVMPYYDDKSKNNPIHNEWTPKAIEKYKATHNGQLNLPIIPDITKGNPGSEVVYHEPEKYPMSKLRELEGPIYNRVSAIINALVLNNNSDENDGEDKEAEVKKYPAIDIWFKPKWHQRIFRPFKNGLSYIFTPFVKKETKSKITDVIISHILKDLSDHDLIDINK